MEAAAAPRRSPRKSPRKAAAEAGDNPEPAAKRTKPSSGEEDDAAALAAVLGLLGAPAAEPEVQRVKAEKYLGRVKKELDAAAHGRWLGMLAAHRAKTLDTESFMEGIRVLFVGRTKFLLQLNIFLPPKSRFHFANLAPKKGAAAPAAAAPAAAAKPEAAAAPLASPAASPPSAAGATAAAAPADDMLAHLTEPGWRTALQREVTKPYFRNIVDHVAKERKSRTIYPPADKVFSAFNFTPFDQVKVVIIGQDPYHGPSQAHGLCFSVERGVAVPPSLKNMYKELEADIPGFKRPAHGNLESWARQGVFMLNASLTVRRGDANSHAKIGWQDFTDSVISTISRTSKNKVVFLLWGNFAKKKGGKVNKLKHRCAVALSLRPPCARALLADATRCVRAA